MLLFILYHDGNCRGNHHLADCKCRVNAIEFESGSMPMTHCSVYIWIFLRCAIFTHIGIKLSIDGYNVVSIDLPGHGMSDGKGGEIDRWILVSASSPFMR